jgi:hypothetical protein
MSNPYVVPSTTRRDLLVGLAIAAVFLALIVFAIKTLSGGVSSSTIDGRIVKKSFTPYHEEQVTFGRGGVQARKRDGEYLFECEAEGRIYLVEVEKSTYQTRNVGDHHLFGRPRK